MKKYQIKAMLLILVCLIFGGTSFTYLIYPSNDYVFEKNVSTFVFSISGIILVYGIHKTLPISMNKRNKKNGVKQNG